MDFKTDHIHGFRIQLGQIEKQIDFSALCVVLFSIAGLIVGFILGIALS